MQRKSNMTSLRRKAGIMTGISVLLPCTTAVMGSAILAPNIPQMIAAYRQTANVEYLVTSLVTLPALCVALFSMLAGAVADIFGRRRAMIAAMGIYGAAGILPLFLHDIWHILGSRLVVGMMEAFIMTASTVLIGDYFQGARRDTWLALQTTVASISSVLIFPLGGLAGELGWRAPFAMYGFSIILMFLLIGFTWEPESSDTKRSERSSMAGFPWRALAHVCGVSLIGSILFFVPIKMSEGLTEIGLRSPAKQGLIIALLSIGVPIGTLVFKAFKHYPTAILLGVEFGICALGYYGMGHAANYQVLLCASFLNQIGCGLLLPTLLVWTMRQLAFHHRGRGIGIWQSIFFAGQFFGPNLFTWLSLHYEAGSILSTFRMVSVLAALAAGGALVAILLGKGVHFTKYEESPNA